MSQRSPKRPQPHVTQGVAVDLTEEEGNALYEATRRRDNGTAMIVQNVLDTIADRPHTGRNLLDVVVQLIGHMTPEQKRGLTERLPDLLSGAGPNGLPHSEGE